MIQRTTLLIIAMGFAGVVFLPITKNYFREDDFLNLFRIANDPPASFLLHVHGGHLLVVRNLLFYLFERAFGTQPEGYFWLVWMTHLANVALFFAVARALTTSALVACFGAVLWGTYPVHAGSLGWYSVYGQVVAATFLLLVLRGLSRVHAQGRPPGRGTLAGWYALLLGASACFGTGLGVALAFPAALLLLLPAWPGRLRTALAFFSLLVVVPGLYFLLRAAARLAGAPHDTEVSAALVAGLSQSIGILSLLVHLAGFGLTSLVLGVLRSPRSLVAPGFLASLLALVFLFSSRAPRRRLLACALLALGTYGIIAAARVDYYERFAIDAWVAARTARYHYLGSVPLALMLCVAVGRAGEALQLCPAHARLLLLAWLAATAFLHARFGREIDHHDTARAEVDRTLGAIRAAVESQPPGRPVYIANRPFRHVGWLVDRERFPGWAAVFVIFFPDDVVDGRRVYFVEPDRDAAAAARSRRGTRIASLVVATPGTPAGRTPSGR